MGVGGGVGVGAAVGAGFGAGVPATGIDGIGMVKTPPVAGVLLGWVGSSSVIVWHPTRTNAAEAMPQANLLIATLCLESTSEGHT